MQPLSEPLVCPVTGQKLVEREGGLETPDGARRYAVDDGIARLFVTEAEAAARGEGQGQGARHAESVAATVQGFYEESPFPNYNDLETIGHLVQKADRSIFARLLREQIPINSSVLEVGCGTGQLSNYLAATCMARVYAADMTLASLRLGRGFAAANNISGITFAQMNLFHPCFAPGSMDIVISNGVLHHTHDTKAAFLSIAPLVKPGGHLIVGLYNTIGRLRTDMRRQLYRLLGERALFLDPHLRGSLSPEKRRAWVRDQYIHPQERKHSISETIGWLAEAGFVFVNSIPKIVGSFSATEQLFKRNDPGRPIDRVMAELEMLFSQFGGEGGLFIVIGRRA